MGFGKYLEACLKKRNISLNSAANMLELNRGDLYHIIEGKRKLKHDVFSRLVNVIPFSVEEIKKLNDLYFSDYYENDEYEKIRYICKKLQNVNKLFDVEDFVAEPFQKQFNLKNEAEILSAIYYLCQNSNGEKVVTNYSFLNKRVDGLFYKMCCDGILKEFCHIFAFNLVSTDIYNFEVLFTAFKYIYKKQFPIYYYSELPDEDKTAYSYFCLTKDGAVLFNENSGIFVENKQTVAQLNKKAEKIIRECKPLGAEMPDIFDRKDFYIAATSGAKSLVNFSARPCVMSFADRSFIDAICKKDVPNREYVVHMASEYYEAFNKNLNHIQFVTLEGIDLIFENRECFEIPSEYADLIPKANLRWAFEKMYEAAKENRFFIVNTKKLTVPVDFQLEITPAGAVICGYKTKTGEPTERIFVLSINDKALNHTLNCFVDYLVRADLVFSKDTTLAYLSNRIVALEY